MDWTIQCYGIFFLLLLPCFLYKLSCWCNSMTLNLGEVLILEFGLLFDKRIELSTLGAAIIVTTEIFTWATTTVTVNRTKLRTASQTVCEISQTINESMAAH